MAADLIAHGHEVVPWGTPCDVAIINTCAVTGIASRKSRQAAGAIRRRVPGAAIVAVGCEASADGAEWVRDGLAELVVPNPKPTSISSLLDELPPPNSPSVLHESKPLQDGFSIDCDCGNFLDHSRANIKIQEGCDFRCTYCIVPDTRGHACSRDFKDILREAKGLLTAGYRELVITGVNIATYRNGGRELPELLEDMLALGTDFRIRLGSTEAGGGVLPRLVSLMKREPRICRFLHLPVQHGADSVLLRMGRHYSAAEFRDQVLQACRDIPGLCLGTDVIVGFPGEGDREFDECRQFLEEIPFGLMHVFVYSPRKGTPAAGWKDKASAHVAKMRSNELLEMAARKAEMFARSQAGKTLQVLVEKVDNGTPYGWSDNYLKVFLPNCNQLMENDMVQAVVLGTRGGRELLGRLAQLP